MVPAADAAVRYSGVMNLPVNSSQSRNIDLNDDGVNDFRFGYFILGYFPYPYYVNFHSVTGGQGHIAENYHSDPARLPSNYPVGSNLVNPSYYWDTGDNTLNGTIYYGSTSTMGNFNNATGYIGVRFAADCGTAYGWIQYQGVTTFGNTASGTIIDWAYEDNCQPIMAGEKTGYDVPVPTMNQWGLIVFTLLLGALAARELRRSTRKKGDASA